MNLKNLFYIRTLFEKQRSVCKPARCYHQILSCVLIFCVFLLGCSSKPNKNVDPIIHTTAELTFEQHEIVTGIAKHQTVLTGFFLDGTIAELAVVNITPNENRLLQIYVYNNRTWVPKLDITLRPEVLFVDVVNIGGHDRLIAYEQDRLNWLDPETATEHILVNVTSNALPVNEGIPHIDITRDVNGDARDDLVIPDTDGFWVFIQLANGTFADPVKIGPTTDADKLYRVENYRHDPWARSRIHEMDYNRDGRIDLVFWNVDHFEVHLQNDVGLFSATPKIFTTDVVFDSDELASLAAPEGVRYRRKDNQPFGHLTGRVLHTLTDMNGDGIADLGVFSLKGGTLWHMYSTYEVHFGMPIPNGTVFAPQVGTSIMSDGIPFGLLHRDFDGDGQVDMAFTTINPNIFKAIGMIIDSFVTHSGSLDFEIYRMENGTYPEKPTAIRKIRSRHPDKTTTRTAFPPVLIGDVSGDGRLDMLVGRSGKNPRIFRGMQGPDMFSRRSQRVAVIMPIYEEYTWLAVLNKDIKEDILMHHTSTTESNRVTILISR